MARSFVQPGGNIDFTTAADVTSGDVIIAGNLVGIAANTTIGAGKANVFTIDGVFKVAKAVGALGQGVKVYWNATSKNVSTTNTDQFMGYTTSAALSADATVPVLLVRTGA